MIVYGKGGSHSRPGSPGRSVLGSPGGSTLSGAIPVHNKCENEPAHVSRLSGRPVSAKQDRAPVWPATARPASALPRQHGENSWVVRSMSRPGSAGVQRGRIRPQSAMARSSGTQASSSEDDLEDTYSVASTRRGKPSRASSPSTYTSGKLRPGSALSRPMSALSRDSETVQEDDEVSTIMEGQEQVISRTYYTRDIPASDGKARMSHFNVKISVAEAELMDQVEPPVKTSYLRIYYSDMLGVPPAEAPFGPNDRTVEVEKMAAWLVEAAPRTRVDAYPLLVLTREILKRFLSKDIVMLQKDAKRLQASLDLTNKALKKTQHDLANSIKEATKRELLIKEIQTRADQLPKLEAEVQALMSRCQLADMKVAEMNKQMDDNKAVFLKKIEQAKTDAREKSDAANAKRLETLENQLQDGAKRLEMCREELQKAKEKTSMAEKQLKVATDKFDQQLKVIAEDTKNNLSFDDVFNAVEKLEIEGKGRILRHLMTSYKKGDAHTDGSFLHELRSLHQEKNPDVYAPFAADAVLNTPFLRLMQQHNLYANGKLLLHSYAAVEEDAKWALCMAMMVEHAYTGTYPAPTHFVDALLMPAMEYAVGHEQIMNLAGVERVTPGDPQLEADLESGKQQINDLTTANGQLTNANGQLQETIKDLEAQLEEARKQPEPEPVVQAVEEVTKVEVAKKTKEKPVDWSQVARPKALAVFKIDPKIFKGKIPQPARVDQMLTWFASIYEGKSVADTVDDREGNARQSFPEYMRDWMINKFGLKSIALSNLASLVMGVQKNVDNKDPGVLTRIRMFGHMSGIIPHDCWHEDLSHLILQAMSLLFGNKISENMGHAASKRPMVEATLCLEATETAWKNYGYGKVPGQLSTAMIQMSRSNGGAMPLNDWLDLLVMTWLECGVNMEKDLKEIFVKHDTNGDGVLDLGEFRDMVNYLLGADHPADERQVSRLFAEALEESEAMRKDGEEAVDEDVMQPEAFVRVARKARLYTPTH